MATILLVDDSKLARDLLTQQLQSSGYDTLTAPDGREAIKVLLSHKVDLIISDVNMPVMDGFTFCRAVKRDKRFRNLPFILLTGRDLMSDKLEGLQYGADLYICKPYDADKLQAAVREMLTAEARFCLTVRGKRWFEFTFTNNSIFIDEINRIINDLTNADETLADHVEAVITVINLVKRELLDRSDETFSVNFSFACSEHEIILRFSGFSEGALAGKEAFLDELRRYSGSVMVGQGQDQLLLSRPLRHDDEPVADELAELETTLMEIENKVMALTATTTTSVMAREREQEKTAKQETTKKDVPAKTAPKAKRETEPPVDASYTFSRKGENLVFTYTPAANGGKQLVLDDLKLYCRDAHLINVKYDLIKELLRRNRPAQETVAKGQRFKEGDGAVRIEFDEQCINAYLTILPPSDLSGKKVTFDYALSIVKLYAFASFNEAELKTIFTDKSRDRHGRYLIATGTAPEKGQDAEIKYSAWPDTEPIRVKRGQLLLYKSPLTGGKAGIDVFGKAVPPESGRKIDIHFESHIIRDKKGCRFFAAVDGSANFTDDTLILFPADPDAKDFSLKTTCRFISLPFTEEEPAGSDIAEYLNLKEDNLVLTLRQSNGQRHRLFMQSRHQFQAPTLAEVKEQAAVYFNTSSTAGITCKVIQQEKAGLLGVGQRDCIAEVTFDPGQAAQEHAKRLLTRINMQKRRFKSYKNKFIKTREELDQAGDTAPEELKTQLQSVKAELLKVSLEMKTVESELQDLITD